jgi:hypothetical protein
MRKFVTGWNTPQKLADGESGQAVRLNEEA